MANTTNRSHEQLVNPDQYREAISRFATGVTVITTSTGHGDRGTTASAVSSLSLDPPMILVCLNRASSTQQAVQEAGFFAVNVLGDDQAELAYQFAQKGGDKFASVDIERGSTGAPLLSEALAYFECRVAELAKGGTHTVFLADVERAVAREGTPLTYFRGTFGRLENTTLEVAYRQIRELVLERKLPLGQTLDFGHLGQLLDLERQQIYYALTRLSSEGLVVRDPDRGYFVKPLDAKSARDALDARCAVEMAVVDMIADRVEGKDLARLRRWADVAASRAAVSPPDLDACISAAREFHEYLVGLSDNPPLIDTARRLGIHAIWARALQRADWASAMDFTSFSDEVDALQRGDAAATKRRIKESTRALKQVATEVIEGAGGTM